MRSSILSLYLSTLALVTFVAQPAFAQGINLYWNDCGGGGSAVVSKTFACDANTGEPLTMVLSVFPPIELPQFVGLEATVEALVNGPSLPDWWQTAIGQCRAGAVIGTCDLNSFGTLSCLDVWDGATTVSISQVTSAPVPGAFRLRFAGAVSMPSPITAAEVNEELVVGVVRISRVKSVGVDACAGCLVGACFVADQVSLKQSADAGDVILTNPGVNNWVQLNGGTGNYNCYVPAVNRTWGAIKTLYR